MKILIVGGNGTIGNKVVSHFLKEDEILIGVEQVAMLL